MYNKKNGLIFCGVLLLLIILAVCSAGSSTPKTVDQFIRNYNEKIKTVTASRVSDTNSGGYYAFLKRCSINNVETAVNGSKMAVLYGERGGFISYDYPKSFNVGFALSKDISSDGIFSIIEAAILAAGDDYDSVMKSLGTWQGNKYTIPGEYDRKTTVKNKTYALASIDEYILLNITIPK